MKVSDLREGRGLKHFFEQGLHLFVRRSDVRSFALIALTGAGMADAAFLGFWGG